jgi:hypothetical protein
MGHEDMDWYLFFVPSQKIEFHYFQSCNKIDTIQDLEKTDVESERLL